MRVAVKRLAIEERKVFGRGPEAFPACFDFLVSSGILAGLAQ
jgi:hypothetical protein